MNPNAVIELHNVAIFHQEDELREANFGRHGRMGDMVLSDVNLEVYPGEMVYLIGRVGSGKSSLLKTLYAELPLKEWGVWWGSICDGFAERTFPICVVGSVSCFRIINC